jgi:hypothetical protein
MFLVATEDELSEAVARRLVREARGTSNEIKCIRQGGFGYLKRSLRKFSEAARKFPVLILTDLDKAVCAPNLVSEWLGSGAMPSRLVFRVAVREVESWLLADREAMAQFLNVSSARIERDCEAIAEPKEYLLSLARRAPSDLRHDLLPRRGAAAAQGFGYNARLCEFVDGAWSPQRAAEASQSLKKAIERIGACVASFPDLAR